MFLQLKMFCRLKQANAHKNIGQLAVRFRICIKTLICCIVIEQHDGPTFLDIFSSISLSPHLLYASIKRIMIPEFWWRINWGSGIHPSEG